jgi:MFS family permease
MKSNLPKLFGFLLFVGMMAAGYYYNLTFVQLGLEDFGTSVLGLSTQEVARDMALLALMACIIAIAFGWWMQRRGWGKNFRLKLRLSFAVSLTQTLLTLICPLVTTETGFIHWLGGVSLTLGVGVPVMFSMTVDLIPVRWRGGAAALVTASAYFFAETLSSEWTFEAFRRQSLFMLLGGVIGMGALAFVGHPWLDALAKQHQQPEFALGRFARLGLSRWRIPSLILIMFGIYFVDSLGFLRLLKTPIYMENAWQSSDLDTRAFIAVIHVIGALAAGALYPALRERSLFLWIFGTFALAHLQYNFHIQTDSINAVLSMPMLYALAVSLYTVINFAVWADLSTPDTISLNSALGVALSGWTATFLSTSLAIYWGESLPLDLHIRIVNSLAMLFFLAMLALAFFEPVRFSKQKTP